MNDPVGLVGVDDTVPAAPAVVVRRARRRSGDRDSLLDLIRSVAIVRVVAWHTWSWAWLSWIPAMPAMFFTTGALLEGSLARRGWLSTVQARARRLLIPYWAYAAACWVLMWAFGWRPSLAEAAAWILPVADPVGSADFPGLWVPLWYVRAYIWFVLGGAALRWLHRSLGAASLGAAAAVGVAVAWAVHSGRDVPVAVADAAVYAPFVLAGMFYVARRTRPRPAVMVSMAISAAAASLVIWRRLGPADAVVNRSYLLTMTVGLAGVALVLAAAVPLLRGTRSIRPAIATVNSRALTIYLWQGFGLVAAQRLVGTEMDAWWKPVAAVAVVGSVIAGAVVVFGRLEDLAARRSVEWPRGAAMARSAAIVVLAVVVMAASLTRPVGDTEIEAPLSGRAVVDRAQKVQESLDAGTADTTTTTAVPGATVESELAGWAARNEEALTRAGTTWVNVAVVAPDGSVHRGSWTRPGAVPEAKMPWWSLTKTVTAGWLLRMVESGTVALDDPLSKWVPETPRAPEMTLGMLAQHRAGVPEDLTRHIFDANPREEIDSFIERGQLEYEPGEGYGYSRIGYYLLALALERASGVPYHQAVADMAREAGAELELDDVADPRAQVTDPDGHGYRGGPWSSGGMVSTTADGAQFLHWLFTEGLTSARMEELRRFDAVEGGPFYGIGVVPLCPCTADGDYVISSRVGLDSAPGLYGVDLDDGSTVMIHTDTWWTEEEALPAFPELQQLMLNLAPSL